MIIFMYVFVLVSPTRRLTVSSQVGIPTVHEKITTVWGSFIGVLVQAYFIHRGFVLSNNWYFLISTSACALLGLVGSIIFVRVLMYVHF